MAGVAEHAADVAAAVSLVTCPLEHAVRVRVPMQYLRGGVLPAGTV